MCKEKDTEQDTDIDERLAKAMSDVANLLFSHQETLPPEFYKVLHDHYEELLDFSNEEEEK